MAWHDTIPLNFLHSRQIAPPAVCDCANLTTWAKEQINSTLPTPSGLPPTPSVLRAEPMAQTEPPPLVFLRHSSASLSTIAPSRYSHLQTPCAPPRALF